jgi:hypothetical protein
VWIGSDGPNDVGPDANWIVNPDTHNPFAVAGPNDARTFLLFIGSIFVLSGFVATFALRRWANRPRWIVAWHAV